MNKLLIILSFLMPSISYAQPKPASASETAIFAGGCFWCMEKPFEAVEGVKEVISGFSGGTIKNPSYRQVASGKTKHIEVVEVRFDPTIVSYETLLKVFWMNVNPTDAGGQFVDRGHQYSTAIFYKDADQKKKAEASKAAHEKKNTFKAKIVTPIRKAGPFYAAEEYHQDYYKKNPIRYKFYRYNSGRDKYLDKIWKK